MTRGLSGEVITVVESSQVWRLPPCLERHEGVPTVWRALTRDISVPTVQSVSYKPRDESPGYHHVVTRGNNKRTIYEEDRDRMMFCLTVDRIAAKYGWTIIAYCLMRNHYHLIIRVGEKGLSDGMCELNTAYAIQFNVWHGRINHLFGKRFWSRRLRSEGALFNAVRYVIRNPVMDGGAKAARVVPVDELRRDHWHRVGRHEARAR